MTKIKHVTKDGIFGFKPKGLGRKPTKGAIGYAVQEIDGGRKRHVLRQADGTTRTLETDIIWINSADNHDISDYYLNVVDHSLVRRR